jgi:hypothetical protein
MYMQIIVNDCMISSLSWSLEFHFFWLILDHLSQLISASTSFTMSVPTIILWYSYSVPSLVSLLPTPPPLFCLTLLMGIFLHSHHPLFHLYIYVCYQLHSRLLLFNCIIVIYMNRGCFFMFCYFYLVCKAPGGNCLDRTLCKFWYYYIFDKSERWTTYLHFCGLHVA